MNVYVFNTFGWYEKSLCFSKSSNQGVCCHNFNEPNRLFHQITQLVYFSSYINGEVTKLIVRKL